MDIAEGRVWTFKNAPAQTARVAIQKIEPWPRGGEAVHVSVYGLPPFPNGVPGVITHMPFTREAVAESLLELTGEAPRPDVDISDGHRQWKDDKGGVFTISIDEAVRYVIDAAFNRPSS